MSNFRQFLAESGDMLDISIQAMGKFLTSKKKMEDLLAMDVKVEHKLDGVKLTAVKVANKGTIEDWILAYKGNILYQAEFDYQPNIKVKKESVGASQFKVAIEHFSKLGKSSVPIGTELFIEYLMRKPTLSSNYSTQHKMVLIGTSKSSWDASFGKLKTSNSGLNVAGRDTIAKELKIDVPQLLFSGIMGSERTFASGILNNNLKTLFQNASKSMDWSVPELLVDDIRRLFLEVESKYGGKEEGVVIILPNGKMLKTQQEYQLDKAARDAIKAQFRCDTPEDETQYWQNVQAVALNLANSVDSTGEALENSLKVLATLLKSEKLVFTHPKKTLAQIKDDIQLTAKTQIIKNMKGNNNCLILGKFRVLTKDGHAAMIKRASKIFDKVVICIVTSSDTKDTKDLREKMITSTFPNVEIIHHNSGNLVGILAKSPININAVYAGTDRVNEYRNQLQRSPGVHVREMPRTDSAISASKVIENISNLEYFKQSTPTQIHKMYPQIMQAYT